jgi:hypothetical protein
MAEQEFPVAECRRCQRDVLTHLWLDDRGQEDRRCVHCDAVFDPAHIRWVPERTLIAMGYGAEEDRRCGGGCGTGGCSR